MGLLLKLIVIAIISILLSGCGVGANLGGLEIDDGKGNTFIWSMPDENCIQTGEFTNAKGVKVKRKQVAQGCVPTPKAEPTAPEPTPEPA